MCKLTINEVYGGYGKIDNFTIKPDFFSVTIDGKPGFSTGFTDGRKLEVWSRRNIKEDYKKFFVELNDYNYEIVLNIKRRKKFVLALQEIYATPEPLYKGRSFSYNSYTYSPTSVEGLYIVSKNNNFIKYEVVTIDNRKRMRV